MWVGEASRRTSAENQTIIQSSRRSKDGPQGEGYVRGTPRRCPLTTFELVLSATIMAASCLCPAADAQGEQHDLSDLDFVRTGGHPLVLVAWDPDQLIQGQALRVEIEADGDTTVLPLLDSGEAPDAEQGDGVYAAAAEDLEARSFVVSLYAGQAQLLWSDTIAYNDRNASHALLMQVHDPGVLIDIEPLDVPSGVNEEGGPQAGPGPAPSPPPGGSVFDRAAGPGGSLWAAALTLLTGVLLGLPLGYLLLRARRTRLRRSFPVLPPPPAGPLPPLLERRQVWQVPDVDALHTATVAIAQRMALSGPVLLVPDAEGQRDLEEALAGAAGIDSLDHDRPEAAKILRASRKISHGLPSLILVQGAGALEEALEDEPSDIVIRELVEARKSKASVLVLAMPEQLDELEPSARLSWGPGGLFTEDGSLALPGTSRNLDFDRSTVDVHTGGTDEDLEALRARVDRADNRILAALAARQRSVEAIGRLKAAQDLPVHQPEREAELLAEHEAQAESRGLDPALIKDLFERILAHSRRSQQR
jgi:chorismate mutase